MGSRILCALELPFLWFSFPICLVIMIMYVLEYIYASCFKVFMVNYHICVILDLFLLIFFLLTMSHSFLCLWKSSNVYDIYSTLWIVLCSIFWFIFLLKIVDFCFNNMPDSQSDLCPPSIVIIILVYSGFQLLLFAELLKISLTHVKVIYTQILKLLILFHWIFPIISGGLKSVLSFHTQWDWISD